MLEPILSPKIEAYITVLDKIRTLKLSRGLYNAQYTREVNREIDGIRARLRAAAKRANSIRRQASGQTLQRVGSDE